MDLFLYGCVVWILFIYSFHSIWTFQPAAMFKVLKESPAIPENLSAEGKNFLNLCFKRNPAERPSAAMLLEHHFIRSPQPPDVLSQSLGGMKLTVNCFRTVPSLDLLAYADIYDIYLQHENANFQRERSSYKLDQVLMSPAIQPTNIGLVDK